MPSLLGERQLPVSVADRTALMTAARDLLAQVRAHYVIHRA